MIELYMWCQFMTAKGAETLKVKAALTNKVVCGKMSCSQGVYVQQPGDTQYALMAENMCFYSKPKQEEI